ncbi:LacI family DNA-binding transcriptional regulator [Paracoccus yeei]|nr:LacI family DNA-binding transcriptional regulator [Paracoccus yeei]OWJ94786.1 LacI family transcriptional regulator [Paracoccus yeei]
MRKRATAREVAEVAGVSKWTVMRAFTPGASIAEEKKRRILEAAKALNYTPNLLARSLATNHTHQVAVFVDDFANPQKLPYLELLTDRLQSRGLVAALVNITTRFDHVHALLNADQRQVDAVILFGTAFRDETLRDRRLGRGMPPTFVLARDSQIEDVPAITCDAEQALREIVDHLHERGYRRPGYMVGAPALSTALGRREHFEAFWARKGVTEIAHLDAGTYSSQGGAAAMRAYLDSTPASERIDVLMCENDILAMGASDVIRHERSLRVPHDVALVGFDNFELCGVPSYGLTTYEQPIQEMVEAVVDMVLGRRPPQTLTLPGRLVIRATT